jgi:hypothetical protein
MAAFYEKIKLYQGLLSQEMAYAGHFYLTIELTRRCNVRCYGCHYHSPQGIISPKKDEVIQDYSLDLFRKVIVELKTMGTRSICLSAKGEPARFSLAAIAAWRWAIWATRAAKKSGMVRPSALSAGRASPGPAGAS